MEQFELRPNPVVPLPPAPPGPHHQYHLHKLFKITRKCHSRAFLNSLKYSCPNRGPACCEP